MHISDGSIISFIYKRTNCTLAIIWGSENCKKREFNSYRLLTYLEGKKSKPNSLASAARTCKGLFLTLD